MLCILSYRKGSASKIINDKKILGLNGKVVLFPVFTVFLGFRQFLCFTKRKEKEEFCHRFWNN